MNVQQLGIEIYNIRKNLKLTQRKLSEGICTQPTISMIEKGEILPNLDTIYYLSLRLNKPFTYFLNVLFMNNYNHIHQLVNHFEELTAQHKYEQIYEIVVNQISEPMDQWLKHFLTWQLYLSSYKLKKINYHQAIDSLKELLTKKYSIVLDKDFLRERICNTIAFIYAMNGEYKSALIYYNKISLEPVDEKSPKMSVDIYILRVIYNKSKTFYDMKAYKEAIALLLKGIERSIKLENMSFLGHYNYYLAKCYERTEQRQDLINSHYKNAGFFFKLLNNSMYYQIVYNEQKHLFQ